MGTTIEKSLIRKYLEGNCNPSETQQVHKYLEQPDAQKLFDEIWDEDWADQIRPFPVSKKQLKQWQQKMDERIYETAMEEPYTVPLFKQAKIWRYAAIWIALILGATIWTFKATQQSATTEMVFVERVNPNGKRTILTLPDSSVVHLGAGSRIRFAQHFNGLNRAVELQGEAFFEVTKNPNKPFIITTGNIQTKVLGTSFKVDAFKEKPMKVMVSAGKVRVDRNVGGKLAPIALLLPGQMVTWDEQKQEKVLAKVMIAELSDWKNGKLVFNQTQLAEIASILERWYNVNIKINNQATARKLMKVNLTTNISIDKVMKILSASGRFTYQIKANQITIN